MTTDALTLLVIALMLIGVFCWIVILSTIERTGPRILEAIRRLEQRISPALPEHESRDDDADN